MVITQFINFTYTNIYKVSKDKTITNQDFTHKNHRVKQIIRVYIYGVCFFCKAY